MSFNFTQKGSDLRKTYNAIVWPQNGTKLRKGEHVSCSGITSVLYQLNMPRQEIHGDSQIISSGAHRGVPHTPLNDYFWKFLLLLFALTSIHHNKFNKNKEPLILPIERILNWDLNQYIIYDQS